VKNINRTDTDTTELPLSEPSTVATAWSDRLSESSTDYASISTHRRDTGLRGCLSLAVWLKSKRDRTNGLSSLCSCWYTCEYHHFPTILL